DDASVPGEVVATRTALLNDVKPMVVIVSTEKAKDVTPTVIGSLVVRIHRLLPLAVPSDTGTTQPPVTSASWSKSVARDHAPAATTYMPLLAAVDWSLTSTRSPAMADTPSIV